MLVGRPSDENIKAVLEAKEIPVASAEAIAEALKDDALRDGFKQYLVNCLTGSGLLTSGGGWASGMAVEHILEGIRDGGLVGAATEFNSELANQKEQAARWAQCTGDAKTCPARHCCSRTEAEDAAFAAATEPAGGAKKPDDGKETPAAAPRRTALN